MNLLHYSNTVTFIINKLKIWKNEFSLEAFICSGWVQCDNSNQKIRFSTKKWTQPPMSGRVGWIMLFFSKHFPKQICFTCSECKQFDCLIKRMADCLRAFWTFLLHYQMTKFLQKLSKIECEFNEISQNQNIDFPKKLDRSPNWARAEGGRRVFSNIYGKNYRM